MAHEADEASPARTQSTQSPPTSLARNGFESPRGHERIKCAFGLGRLDQKGTLTERKMDHLSAPPPHPTRCRRPSAALSAVRLIPSLPGRFYPVPGDIQPRRFHAACLPRSSAASGSRRLAPCSSILTCWHGAPGSQVWAAWFIPEAQAMPAYSGMRCAALDLQRWTRGPSSQRSAELPPRPYLSCAQAGSQEQRK